MPAPYNYMAMIPRPDLARKVQAGLALGEAIGGAVQAGRQREQEEMFQTDLQSALKNPTFGSFRDLMAKYPTQAENISKLNQTMSDEEKRSTYDAGIDIYTAMESGYGSTAIRLMNEQIAARKNAGLDTTRLEDIRNQMQTNPQAAKAGIGMWLAGSDPKRWSEAATAFDARQKAQGEARKASAEAGVKEAEQKYAEQVQRANIARTSAEIGNISSQINDRAERLKLDRAKAAEEIARIQSERGQIPEAVRKDADAAIVNAGVAKTSADQMNSLADRIQANSFGTEGVFATADQWLADSLGVGEDEVNDIRKEFTRLRNSEVVKSLPPGPATDRDISIFAEGYIKATASPERMAAYLRGAAKARDIESRVEAAKADWLTNNRSLQRAKTPFQAGDYTVNRGESLLEFQQRVAKDVNAKYAEESKQRELFPVTPGMAGQRAPAGTSITETGILEAVQRRPAAGAAAPAAGDGFTLMGTRPVSR